MSTPHAAPYYFVPGPSRWPMAAGLSMMATMFGAAGWVNGEISFDERIGAVRTLQAFTNEPLARGRFSEAVERAYRAAIQSTQARAISSRGSCQTPSPLRR